MAKRLVKQLRVGRDILESVSMSSYEGKYIDHIPFQTFIDALQHLKNGYNTENEIIIKKENVRWEDDQEYNLYELVPETDREMELRAERNRKTREKKKIAREKAKDTREKKELDELARLHDKYPNVKLD